MNGRYIRVYVRNHLNRCTEESHHPLIDQVLAIVTLPIGNARAGYGAMEAISLRNCPHRHEAAVTPPRHAETRRIDRIFFYRGIDPGEDVAQIARAEIFHVGAGELFTLTVTSTRIRQ